MRRLAVGLGLAFPLFAFLPVPAAEPPKKPPQQQGLTGAVDEERFKALHQLKEGQAPPRKGTRIDLAGTSAYLSLPPGAKAPLPAVIVIHEWWGLNEHIEHWADRLAADGYAALAVDLFGGKIAKTPDEAMAAVKAVDATKALEVLKAAHRFLAEAPTVQAKRRGVVGWCFGGGWALQAALAIPDLDAAVMYYGRLVTDRAQLEKLRTPLLGIFGNEDESIPPAAVNEFEQALKAAGKNVKVMRYDAPHAFANPSNPKYDQEAAEAAWKETSGWLRRYLKG